MKLWDIKDLSFQIDEPMKLINCFNILDSTNSIHKPQLFKEQKISTIFTELNEYKSKTGIVVCDFTSENISLYLLIFDNVILIIKKSDIYQFQDFFKRKYDSFLFLSKNCEDEINTFNFQQRNSIEKNTNLINKKKLINQIKDLIIYAIIKKSQYRTLQKRLKSEEYFSLECKLNDFISLKFYNSTNKTRLVYNTKNQFLYILKEFIYSDPLIKKSYKHEIQFYESTKNEFPYISKYCGTINKNQLKYIILEYIEGQTLYDFINGNNNIDYSIKIKFILEILFAVEYIHSKGIFLRDLKWDNILIDSELNAILIDFDSTKKIDVEINQNNDATGGIGSLIFSAPEQNFSNNYSFKADIYSIGMIIHFIIIGNSRTLDMINYNFLQFIYQSKENILDKEDFAKSDEKFDEIKELYKPCLEVSPESRPNISKITNEFIITIYNEYSNNDRSSKIGKNLKSLIIKRFQLFQSNYENSNEQSFIDKTELFFFIGFLYYKGDYIEQNINKSIYYLSFASDNNHSEAQFLLGYIYFEGKYISRNLEKSIQYLTLSSNQDNSNAQFVLGEIYYTQKYGHFNIEKSIYYLTLAADKNDLNSLYLLGIIYYEGKYISGNLEKSIHYLTLAADQNHHDSQAFLGVLLYKGDPKYRNIDKSIKYLKIAAESDDPSAQYCLGCIFYKGEFIKRDINKAIKYFLLSSKHNNKKALYFLGEIYYLGQYIIRDIDKSIYYLTLASDLYSKDARSLLGAIFYDNKFTPRNIEKSLYYFSLAANDNDSNSQYFLGLIYYEGIYVSQDISKTIYYFTLASKQNHQLALYYLGGIYYEGKYVIQDNNKAIYYLTLAANQNNPNSQYLLGAIYYLDRSITTNINKAIYYLTLAANQGDSNAQFLLGTIFYFGKYTQRNISKSIYFFKESSCFNDNRAKSYLGIIYKNGDGVKKNIYGAIEYFQEAIEQKNDLYSMFNLSRIYYFGIDIQKNVSKSLYYLKKASKGQFLMADLFLYFIYFCGDENTIDSKESQYYQNRILKVFHFDMISLIDMLNIKSNEGNNIFHKRLFEFFKQYDLLYDNNEPFSDFCYYMNFGVFKSSIIQDSDQKKSSVFSVNADFYDGFYND